MKIKCKIRAYRPFNRWVILAAHDMSLAWSGSKWVPLFPPFSDVQVSNFATQSEAEQEAIAIGFEIVP
jgi:hypothetical protein